MAILSTKPTYLHILYLNHIEEINAGTDSCSHSAVDSFSNPGVLVIIDSLSLFLSSFLNQKIPGVLWYPSTPAIYTTAFRVYCLYNQHKLWILFLSSNIWPITKEQVTILTLLGLGLIKINTVAANFNNLRPSLILNN